MKKQIDDSGFPNRTKVSHRVNLRQFAVATAGILLLAINIDVLSWQFKIVTGGMPGYALALNYLLHIPVGAFLLVINSIILVLLTIVDGKTAGLKAIYGYILLSVSVEFFRQTLNISSQDSTDLALIFLVSFMQGITAPIAIAMVLRNGYTFGSWTSLYPIATRVWRHVTAPQFFFLMDGILTVIVLVTLGPIKALLLLVNAVAFFFSFRFCMSVNKKHE